MQLKIIVPVPHEGQGPRVQFRVQVTSSHETCNITTSRSISSHVTLCIGHWKCGALLTVEPVVFYRLSHDF